MTTKKQENIDFFNSNFQTYLANNMLKSKFVVIHNKELKASFDTFSSALEFASSKFPTDEFVIQQVIGQDEQINFIRSAI